MTIFTYKAIRADGDIHEGEIEAHDQAAVIRKLQAEGLMPLRIREGGASGLARWFKPPASGKALTAAQIGLLTRELATLLEAGLTLDRSLQVIIELADEEALKKVLVQLQERVRGGATFSVALEGQSHSFSRLYINMVRAGEAGGALDLVLVRLAEFLDRSAELRSTIQSALVYPAILLGVSLLSVILLLTFVVPQFAQLFKDMGGNLPLATRIVIGTGAVFQNYWWLLLSVGAGGTALVLKRLENPAARTEWDRKVLTLPLFGDLVKKMETARFCRTLATLMENGLPLLSALGLAKEVIGNQVLAHCVADTTEDVKRGRGLAEPLGSRGLFPRLALQMIKVGEESGKLEPMLAKVADLYDRETRATVQRMLTLIEPLMIIGLGVIVAGIIMSILVAILGANDLVF